MFKNSFAIPFFLFVLALNAVGRTQEPDPKTNELLQQVIKKHGLVGMTCCVIKDGKIVALGAAGVRKIGTDKRITVDDKMHLGSCTKAMTATLVAQLVEEGKLKWDTRLLDVFPRLKDEIHPDFHGVTITDLVTHTSGVVKNNVDGWPRNKPVRTLRYELLKRSLKPKPENQVGKFVYSNLGFIAAGAMLEKVTSKKWEDLIKTRLFKKLGMTSAGFGPPGLKQFESKSSKKKNTSKKIDQPWGHIKNKEGEWIPIRHDNPPILGPAGTVHCSIKDWAKFVSLHVSWVKRKPEMLNRDTLKLLQTRKSVEGNAYGWFSMYRSWGKGMVLNHNGSNTFWMANVWASPNVDFAVMTITNCCSDDVAKPIDEVATAMINRFLN